MKMILETYIPKNYFSHFPELCEWTNEGEFK